jgi:hypothetical protein
MGELDLEPPFRGRRPLAEDLEDQAGSVDDLALDRLLQILLLDRRHRPVDDEELGLGLAHRFGDLVDLPLSEQGLGTRRPDLERALVLDVDPDRLGQARRFLEPRLDVSAAGAAEVRKCDECSCSAGDVRFVAVENAQTPFSSGMSSAGS